MILEFFAASDGIIFKNIAQRFMKEIKVESLVLLWVSDEEGEFTLKNYYLFIGSYINNQNE